jgi:hypothetical protein
MFWKYLALYPGFVHLSGNSDETRGFRTPFASGLVLCSASVDLYGRGTPCKFQSRLVTGYPDGEICLFSLSFQL